jgi:transcriptional regulator with XRE-family HTH domain
MKRIVMTVGENIRHIRQEHGLTPRQLDEMVVASEAYIRAYKSDRRNHKRHHLKKLQRLYLSI